MDDQAKIGKELFQHWTDYNREECPKCDTKLTRDRVDGLCGPPRCDKCGWAVHNYDFDQYLKEKEEHDAKKKS